jgi:hypothetical protein
MLGVKRSMPQETPNIFRCIRNETTHNHETVVCVTEPTAKKSLITGDKGDEFLSMKVAKNLFEVLPFRAPDLMANLLWSQSSPLEKLNLLGGNVVVEQDHAAALALGNTSRTIPFVLNVAASRTA